MEECILRSTSIRLLHEHGMASRCTRPHVCSGAGSHDTPSFTFGVRATVAVQQFPTPVLNDAAEEVQVSFGFVGAGKAPSAARDPQADTGAVPLGAGGRAAIPMLRVPSADTVDTPANGANPLFQAMLQHLRGSGYDSPAAPQPDSPASPVLCIPVGLLPGSSEQRQASRAPGEHWLLPRLLHCRHPAPGSHDGICPKHMPPSCHSTAPLFVFAQNQHPSWEWGPWTAGWTSAAFEER